MVWWHVVLIWFTVVFIGTGVWCWASVRSYTKWRDRERARRRRQENYVLDARSWAYWESFFDDKEPV